mgnify:CR=1 FL=1
MSLIKILEEFYNRRPKYNKKPGKASYGRFKSLVSVMLSAQSRDEKTAEATHNLWNVATTPEQITGLDAEYMQSLIKPAGLYRNKQKNIQAMCKILIEKFNSKVPTTRDELMSLPGVGRKCTDIMMRFVYNEPAVPVDTHVHRLANRLGLCETKTEYLEKNIPLDYKWGAHMWFITHGKYVCKARPPQCAKCFLQNYCKHYNDKIRINNR